MHRCFPRRLVLPVFVLVHLLAALLDIVGVIGLVTTIVYAPSRSAFRIVQVLMLLLFGFAFLGSVRIKAIG